MRKKYSIPEDIALFFTAFAVIFVMKYAPEFGLILSLTIGLLAVFLFTFGTLKITTSLSPEISHSTTPLKRSLEMLSFFALIFLLLLVQAIIR